MRNDLSDDLKSLVIFRELLEDNVIKGLRALLDAGSGERLSAYCEFCSRLFEKTEDLSQYVLRLALRSENPYIKRAAAGEPVPEVIEASAKRELKILERAGAFAAADIIREIAYDGELPQWNNSSADYTEAYREMAGSVGECGYGVYADYTSFLIRDGRLTPVENPDPIRLSELGGYERERGMVVDNTLALLDGRPAANVLLYGDSGTGKSSSVKAIVNEYSGRGLRLVELGKKQLRYIPELLDRLYKNPLKFILFIDDLSFTENDDDFAALKAILEGSVAARAGNAAIYATSNRRHLIKESFADREGDEIHVSDTIEELASLSQRFGLTVTFQKPDKRRYIEVVKALAVSYRVNMAEDELVLEAEKYAIKRSGRSPRVAKQFIEMVKSMEMLRVDE